jgi:hypothetical protein
MLFVGVEVAATAILISRRQYQFITGAMFRTLLATLAYLGAASHFGWGLNGVWMGLAVFYGSRASQSIPRMMREVRVETDPAEGGSAALKAA